MKYTLAKPFLFLISFILIVGLACSAETPEPPPEEPVAPVAEVASPVPPPPVVIPEPTAVLEPADVPETTELPAEELDGFVTLTDDTESLYIEVPSTWNDVSGVMWEDTWGALAFTAPNIIAAPSIDDFYGYWSAPGVDFAASTDWGKIGGYVQLLDSAGDAWYKDECEKTGRYDYEDPVYEGRFDVWDCGIDADVIVISARPIIDRTAYLVLVQIQLGEDWGDSDDAVAIHISETFDILGVLP